MGRFRKSDKISVLFLLIVLSGFIWLCRPLPDSEKDIHWFWQELSFWPEFENEAELTTDELIGFNAKIREYEPFQFTLPELETRAFSYDDKLYVLSPEAGLLFIEDTEYIVKLTDSKGRYHGLYALGALQKGDFLYYAEAEKKNHLWLPGLLNGEGIIVNRYKMTYSKFDLQGEGSTFITEKEYMEVRDAFRMTE